MATKKEIVQSAIRIPKDKHKKLRLLSVETDKSLNDLWLEALDLLLKKHSKKTRKLDGDVYGNP